MKPPFTVTIDNEARVVTIQGVRYAFDLFDAFGFEPIGTRLEIVDRQPDYGTLTVRRLPTPAQLYPDDTPITELPLKTMTINALKFGYFKTIGDIRKYVRTHDGHLPKLPNLARKGFQDIAAALAATPEGTEP